MSLLGRSASDQKRSFGHSQHLTHSRHRPFAAMILVRNNPEGDPTPSRVDIEITERIVEIADRLGIVIHDHTIVARNRHASLKSLKPI